MAKKRAAQRYPKIVIGKSKLHGLGLFAAEDIDWGRRIIDYQGQLLPPKEVNRRLKFYESIGFNCLIQFNDGYGIDFLAADNESRFINHSSQANVGAIREDQARIVFYSLQDIAKGDELTFNYGFEPGSDIPAADPANTRDRKR